MTTSELKRIVKDFNNDSPVQMTVDSPSAYGQWRVALKLTTGLFLINWVTVTDWDEKDTFKDLTLIGE